MDHRQDHGWRIWGGEYVPPASGQYFENVSPVNGKVFCEVARVVYGQLAELIGVSATVDDPQALRVPLRERVPMPAPRQAAVGGGAVGATVKKAA